MNRRNCLKLLAGLLPCALVARMLGEKDLHGTPSPAPKTPYGPTAPYGPFIPISGFHIEIRELPKRGMEFEGEYMDLLPCFQAEIRDCKTNHILRIRSPLWDDNDSDKTIRRRFALDSLYQNIGRVIRQRQFPKDTKIYDTEVTVNGVKLMNPRYPE